MYSQNAEEQHILEALGEVPGTFLDVGAYDGVTFSNTRALFERGWKGVLVEPDPHAYAKLCANYAGREGAILLNAALVPDDVADPEPLTFWTSNGDMVSTSNPAHRALWAAAGVPFSEVRVAAIGVLELPPVRRFDFVNLDVEGRNWELLQALPLAEWRTRVICVEYENKPDEMLSLCAAAGLGRLVYRSAENLVIAR